MSPPCRDCPFSNLPFHPFAARRMIPTQLPILNPALPSRNLTLGAHSNPIGPRPPRQPLPPSLLIENASDPVFRPRHLSCPRRFRSRLATIRSSGLLDPIGVYRYVFGESSHKKTSGQYPEFSLAARLLLGDYLVAVGTAIAGRPPRGSVRALASAYGSYLGWWRRSVVLAFRTLANPGDMLVPLCVGCM